MHIQASTILILEDIFQLHGFSPSLVYKALSEGFNPNVPMLEHLIGFYTLLEIRAPAGLSSLSVCIHFLRAFVANRQINLACLMKQKNKIAIILKYVLLLALCKWKNLKIFDFLLEKILEIDV